MSNENDENLLALNSVTDDVGVSRDQFPYIRAAHLPPTMGKVCQAVALIAYGVCDMTCRAWVEFV